MSIARILIADNDPDYLSMIGEILSREGYEVVTARTAAEARQTMEQRGPHLAILDLHLNDDGDERDISGLILAKTVALKIPKITFTPCPTFESVREAMAPAFDSLSAVIDFVPKAEGLEALIVSLRNALGQAE